MTDAQIKQLMAAILMAADRLETASGANDAYRSVAEILADVEALFAAGVAAWGST